MLRKQALEFKEQPKEKGGILVSNSLTDLFNEKKKTKNS